MNDAFRAAAPSRRSRLDFVDPGVLMRLTRRLLFDALWPAQHVINMVRSLTTRGCEEAVWLLSKLTSEGPMPVTERRDKLEEVVSRNWLAEIIAREDSPRAWFYRARLCFESRCRKMVTDLLRQAAEAGFAPAMTSLAMELSGDEMLFWMRKAAALRAPGALRELTHDDESNRIALLLEAASLGDTASMSWLADSSESGLSVLQKAVWRARAQFLGASDFARPELRDAVERMAAGEIAEDDLRLVHATGRELEGFEQLWPGSSLKDEQRYCVNFYLLIVHTARRAALQMILAMRERGLPKEVAILIARFVYDSRDDAVAWCEGGQKARQKSARKKRK